MLHQVAACLLSLVAMQDPAGAPQAETLVEVGAREESTPAPLSYASLSALQRTREAKELALRKLREKLDATTNESERGELLDQVRALQLETEKLTADFESVATGIDMQAFDMEPPSSFDLQAEVQKLIQPLIEELKDATEAPRQIERLRAQLDYMASRETLAVEAQQSVERLLLGLDPSDPQNLRPALVDSRDAWQARIEEIQGAQTVASFQLDKRLSQRKSIFISTQTALGEFFRTRGLNLILAVGTFILVLLLLRGMYRYVARVLPGKQQDERRFYSRLIDVLYFLFVSSFALAAALLVLYATGDWVLLGLTLLFVVGVAWAFKTAIPMFLEQIRLLLNLGTVRERERLLIDGVPYRVSQLSFYTLLSNPELAGGVRRLPIKDLAGMRSRTCSKDEIWFPCKRGDWVVLADGRWGEVKHQSPDMVQLEPPGGARVTYQTANFLAQAPQNLSLGFRRQVRFGVDYAHQPISTTEVPSIFRERIERGLREGLGAEAVRSLRVEFCEAGASSLDYLVLADLDGACAPQYEASGRLIQKLCVDTCNEQGWGIPFTQITLHQAGAS